MKETRGPSLEFVIVLFMILFVAFYFFIRIDRIERSSWMAPAFVNQGMTNSQNIQKLAGAVQKLKVEFEEMKKSEEPESEEEP